MVRMRGAMQQVDENGPELMLLQHSDVITKTRRHGTSSFLLGEDEIAKRGIEIVETDRGGDVTFHGEGQLVGYLVKRLKDSMDLGGYVRDLEASLLRATHVLGLPNAMRVEGKTGVWIPQSEGQNPRKLIAIGVGVSKGVTRHGFALNMTTDLEKFTECIVPCGLDGFAATSLERELGALAPALERICAVVTHEICETFHFREM
jgi:lipoyl(octanoyl) transferase